MTYSAQNSKPQRRSLKQPIIPSGSPNSPAPTWLSLVGGSMQLPSLSAIDWPEAEPASQATTDAPECWDAWLASLFPAYVSHPFAERHEVAWGWADAISLGAPSDPIVLCWGRGGAKSTTAELIAVRWAAKKTRRYGLYLCNTQDQADDHISTIATLMETSAVGAAHPHLADRMLGKYGQSKGWRRNRLRTSDGFTIDALGLDSARRGAKIDEQRPDFIIIDDVDDAEDGEQVTAKKARMLTRKILPALTHDAAILFVQNKVHDDSLMAQVLDGRADFLGGAIISGPHPALTGFEYVGSGKEAIVTAGTATWAGQSVADCQRFIRLWGLDAFLSECQHESVAQVGRFLPSMGLWDACEDKTIPALDGHTPLVLGMDAGESSDTFAIVGLSRWGERTAVRFSRILVPTEGKPLNFDAIEQDIRDFVASHAVLAIAYDPFLLGQMMRRFQGDKPLPCQLLPFPQGQERLKSDQALKDGMLTRLLAHDGMHSDLRSHLDNANAKSSADGRQLRIVKRSSAKKIDGAVALSMGHFRAAELLSKGWLLHDD